MIFVLLFSAWIVSAYSVPVLIAPLVVIMARSSFLDRPVFPKLGMILVGVLVFVLFLVTNSESASTAAYGGRVQMAATWGLRSMLFLMLVRQAVVVIDRSTTGVAVLGGDLARTYQILVRSSRILHGMMADVAYASAVRRRLIASRQGGARWGAWRFRSLLDDLKARVVVISEVVRIARGFEDTMIARGGYPDPRSWKSRGRLQEALYAGDVLLFVLAASLAASVAPEMCPEWVRAAVRWIEAGWAG